MSNKIREVFDQIAAEATRDEQSIPSDIPLMELADMVVRGKVKLSPPQQRMLIEMLPFVAPKLSAIGFVRDADTFAPLRFSAGRCAVKLGPVLVRESPAPILCRCALHTYPSPAQIL